MKSFPLFLIIKKVQIGYKDTNFENRQFTGYRKLLTKVSLRNKVKNAVTCLISNCPFPIGNVVFKQGIGIPMGIYHAPF